MILFSTTKTKMKSEILSENRGFHVGVGITKVTHRSAWSVHRLGTIRTPPGPGEKRSKVSSRGDRCWCERSDFLLITKGWCSSDMKTHLGHFFYALRSGTSPVIIWANHIKSSCLSTINIYKLGKSSCLSTINGVFHGSNIVSYPLLFKNGAPPGSPFKKSHVFVQFAGKNIKPLLGDSKKHAIFAYRAYQMVIYMYYEKNHHNHQYNDGHSLFTGRFWIFWIWVCLERQIGVGNHFMTSFKSRTTFLQPWDGRRSFYQKSNCGKKKRF